MTISGTVAAINRALNGLTYTNSDYVGSDTLSISLSDIGGNGPRTTVASVNLQQSVWNQGQPLNWFGSGSQANLAAPVVTLPSGTLPITGTPAPITGVSVGGAALVNVTLSVQNGVLQVPTTAGVTIEHDGTSSIELIGSATAVNAALAKLTYTGNAGFTGSDSLSVSANAVAESRPPRICSATVLIRSATRTIRFIILRIRFSRPSSNCGRFSSQSGSGNRSPSSTQTQRSRPRPIRPPA